jgi:uncharacterized protein
LNNQNDSSQQEEQDELNSNLPQRVVYPIAPQERIHHLDVIRGIALLGILLANIPAFSFPDIYGQMLKFHFWNNIVDQVSTYLVDWLVQGKFYTTFSFLFGVGFMVILSKSNAKGLPAYFVYSRRVLVLLGIGFIHALFIWWGDILVSYALCGFLLMLFFRTSARTVLVWSFILFAVGMLLASLFTSMSVAQETLNPMYIVAYNQFFQGELNVAMDIYSSGSWADIVARNIKDWQFIIESSLIMAPFSILPMFLLGVYAYKRGLIQQPAQHVILIRKIWLYTLIIGVIFSFLKYVYGAMEATSARIGEQFGSTIGDASLSICYMTTIWLCMNAGIGHKVFQSFAWVGRMALTNYLTQSMICTFIFYGYGLGWFGKVGATYGILIALGLFSIQLYWSRWWLARYNWGPAEWFWRKLTYGKLK